MCSKPLQTFKAKVNKKKAVSESMWRYGLYYCRRAIKTALESTTIPENKEKRFDYNICEAVNDNSALSEIDM